MSIVEYRGRGRPSVYWPVLKRIRDIDGSGWYPVRPGHKGRTAPSALRLRYPGFAFRAVPDGRGGFVIEARWVGSDL